MFNAFYLLIVFFSTQSWATKYNGRLTLGGYTAIERFQSTATTGSDKNDFQVLSTRYFLNVEEMNKTLWEGTFDIRDKFDFFDRLNRQLLTLQEKNEFQVRQFSVKNSSVNQFLGMQFGRFPVKEAGSAFVDGAQFEEHWSKSLYSSIFAGLNPRKEGRSYLDYDSKAQISGISLTYDQQNLGWNKNFYATHAFVSQSYDNHVDRNYLFENIIYQWNLDSRIITLVYFDLVPTSYLQNGHIAWQNGWSQYFTTDLNLTAIDVIEYSRRQNVLERLPSSPYQESEIKFVYKLNTLQNRIYILLNSGQRQVDRKYKQTAELGYIRSEVFGPNWDMYGVLGSRKNFTSQDSLIRLGLGYYSRKWEFNLDSDFETQMNESGSTTHPIYLEGTLSYYFSKSTYLAVSAQTAGDENVNITSGFFRVGYRFGSREIPPVRDGAPPRGPL